MDIHPDVIQRLSKAIDRQRLVDTALRLCEVYSPTRSAGAVSDCLADMLTREGFTVERPTGGWDAAPAVAVRLDSGKLGKTLQFDGHLDTVHLPFVAPTTDGQQITGSGAADMKSGVAAAVEALRVLRSTGLLGGGAVLLTAHDLHEAPWGDGSQLDGLIAAGYVGDGVLIPEYLCDRIAVAGRGQAVFKISITRPGPPVHEVYRPENEPSVIAVGAELVRRFRTWQTELMRQVDPIAGSESVFIGQIHSGEIYNQYPQLCWMEGTRRWLPGETRATVEAEFRRRLDELARETGAKIEATFQLVRDAFRLDVEDPLVATFDRAMVASGAQALPRGAKPFVDDGNSFWHLAGVPAITHGPRGGGAHTLEEWVSIDELVRVALVYAATAVAYCG